MGHPPNLKLKADGTTHIYTYNQAGQLIQESRYSAAKALEQQLHYIWLGDKPVGLVIKDSSSDDWQIYAIHSDHLNTPRLITDQDGAEVWRWASDAFGEGDAQGSITFNLRFPGQYYDAESGLHYNYFRDYNAATGRYVQSDPIGLAGGLNTYGYVASNPIMYFDAYGETPAHVVGAIAGFTFGLWGAIVTGQTGWCAIRSGLYSGLAGGISAGTSLIGGMAAAGALSAAEQVGRKGLDNVSLVEAGFSSLTTGIAGGVGRAVGRLIPKVNFQPSRSKWNPKYWGEKLGWAKPLASVDLNLEDRIAAKAATSSLTKHSIGAMSNSSRSCECE